MSEEFTVITPTGDRPVAFGLCRRWMNQQTVKPTQWIIIDDGKKQKLQLKLPKEYEQLLRREPQSNDPKHTLVKNIELALQYVTTDKVIFWEDDEYYAPTYLEIMLEQLKKAAIVGMGCAKYYHLPTGGYELHGNMKHASLSQTAFNMSVINIIKKCVDMGMEKDWLDCNIWREAVEKKSMTSLIFRDSEIPTFVGIKGLPGRFGIGIGHNAKRYQRKDDKNHNILKKWCPKDYIIYLTLLRRMNAS